MVESCVTKQSVGELPLANEEFFAKICDSFVTEYGKA